MLCPPAWLQRLALSACLVWVALGLVIAVRAGENDNSGAGEEVQASREGILIMRTGAIVTGRILKSGSIYEVQCPTGRMAVPESLVKMRCANLSEGYEKLRASAKAQNAADAHLTLTRWCLANHLEKEARRELADALALEPDREDAKKLLRDVDDVLKKKSEPARPANLEDSVRRARIAAAASDDSVSLGGLSRENAGQFARRIQPLLVGSCTAAGCHGRDSQTDFRLTRVTPGKDTNRHAAERNLAEVLGQIDVAKPRSSPLLTVPRGNHGRRGRQIFSGQRGEEQLAELRNWVVAVSKEEIVREKRGKSREGLVRQASGREESQEQTQTEPAVLPVAKSPAPSASEKIKLPQVPLPASKDPFDPAAFNRGAGARAKR